MVTTLTEFIGKYNDALFLEFDQEYLGDCFSPNAIFDYDNCVYAGEGISDRLAVSIYLAWWLLVFFIYLIDFFLKCSWLSVAIAYVSLNMMN